MTKHHSYFAPDQDTKDPAALRHAKECEYAAGGSCICDYWQKWDVVMFGSPNIFTRFVAWLRS